MSLAGSGLVLVAAAAFLFNPTACSTDPAANYRYGAAEMRAAVEGNWLVTTVGTDAAASFTVHLEQAAGPVTARRLAFIRPAMACGSRTLIKGAAACVDVSQMPLTGKVIDGDQALRAMKVDGQLVVAGLTFSQGDLTLRIGGRSFIGQLSKDGVVSQVYGDGVGGGSATIVRVP
jgi:hypothetical protein